MSYKIAIVEDDPAQRLAIEHIVQKETKAMKSAFSISSFASALDVTDFIFDAYLLDIDMPGEDGIELARTIRSRGSMAVIIFISFIEQRVFEAIRMQPLRFVRKKQLQTELPEALAELHNTLQMQEKEKVILTAGGSTLSLPTNRILYIESQRKTQILLMVDGRRELHSTMQELEAQLPECFLRIQKSYIVNLNAISAVEKGCVLMDNGDLLSVSRSRLEEVKRRFEEVLCR